MNASSKSRGYFTVPFVVAAFAAGCGLAAAQDNSTIAGVWRAREGTPTGMAAGLTSSDVQTMVLSSDGHYRREIIAEGGNVRTEAAGKIVDTGTYSFRSPTTFHYRRSSWVVCAPACLPHPPIGPSSGALPFRLKGQRQAIFLGIVWTKVK